MNNFVILIVILLLIGGIFNLIKWHNKRQFMNRPFEPPLLTQEEVDRIIAHQAEDDKVDAHEREILKKIK